MGKKSSPPPPDYKPVADASAETARISAELGREQLAESKRQYDASMGITRQVVDKQLELMDQTKAQGDEYFNYWKTNAQPVENALNAESMRDTSARDAAERDAITSAISGRASAYDGIGASMRSYGESLAADMMKQAGGIAGGIEAAAGKYSGKINADIDDLTGGNSAMYRRYGKDIEADSDRAVADVRAGQAQATNQAMRQAMRYGMSMSDVIGNNSVQQAQAVAQAANGTRNASIDKYRGLLGSGINARQNLMNTEVSAASAAANIKGNALGQAMSHRMDGAMRGFGANMAAADARSTAPAVARDLRIADDARGWAKKLDVAGLYRGMTGASQGAYSLTNQAGNSAVGNMNATGAQYMNGMAQGTNTIMNGRGLAQQGLTSVMNAQGNVFANGQSSSSIGGIMGGLGGLLGGAAQAGWISDRRLKTDIEAVGTDARSGLTLYEFAYKSAPDGPRFRGVMADEVRKIMPEAVMRGPDGYDRVRYDLIGIDMVQVSAP